MSEASAAQEARQYVAPAAALAACRPYVIRYLRSLGAAAEDAEDLAQDTLLVALRVMPSFRGDSRLATWVCRIARRVYSHWKVNARPAACLSSEEEVPLVVGLEDAVIQRLVLCEGLRRLPEPLRTLVCGHYLQGCSYREICECQGITKTRLTNELCAARRLLRKHMVLQSR